MENKEFTLGELKAIQIVFEWAATQCREDLMGLLMYTGAFRLLEDSDGGVVQLARKIEEI